LERNGLAYGVADTNPSAGYIHSGSKDIDDFAIVGEGGAVVPDRGRADGDGSGLTSRRCVRGVGEFVTS
jgi:hypothetical protein